MVRHYEAPDTVFSALIARWLWPVRPKSSTASGEGGPMDSLLLKDYAPASSLVVPETRIARPRYPPSMSTRTHP